MSLLAACGDVAPDKTWRGLYSWGHEVRSFCPCASKHCYWVQASPGINARLRDFVQANTVKPYQPVYVELQAQLAKGPAGGFASDYDGLLRVAKIALIDARHSCPTGAH